MQTRFPVQLAFAKFLSGIKENFWGRTVSMIGTGTVLKMFFILDRNLEVANCTEDQVCTSCDTVVLTRGSNWPKTSGRPKNFKWEKSEYFFFSNVQQDSYIESKYEREINELKKETEQKVSLSNIFSWLTFWNCKLLFHKIIFIVTKQHGPKIHMHGFLDVHLCRNY